MVAIQHVEEQRILLHNIRWETYEQLLWDQQDRSAPRFTYDRGRLEIMSLSPVHERYSHAARLLIPLIALEIGVRVYGLGSTTFKLEEFERGFEPDGCFYVQHQARMRGKEQIDLHADPPPDLVVEVEISTPLIHKLPIYAQFGVPEVWRYDGESLHILVLEEGDYRERAESPALSGVTADAISRLIADSFNLDDTSWLIQVREWAQGLPGR